MWSKHHSRCVISTNNIMYMQLERVYKSTCSSIVRLVSIISVIGFADRNARVQNLYISAYYLVKASNFCASLKSPRWQLSPFQKLFLEYFQWADCFVDSQRGATWLESLKRVLSGIHWYHVRTSLHLSQMLFWKLVREAWVTIQTHANLLSNLRKFIRAWKCFKVMLQVQCFSNSKPGSTDTDTTQESWLYVWIQFHFNSAN